MDTIIKSVETKTGVSFRVLKNDKYFFAELKFQNYFYVKRIDYELNEEDLLKAYGFAIEKADVVGQFVKITLSNNFMRVKIRTFFEDRSLVTYEADIKANKRFLLDKDIPLHNENIPFCFYDIETDDRKPIKKDDRGLVIADSRILSFAVVDYKGKQIQFTLGEETDEGEKLLLKNILNTFSEYGIISGWNSEKFDMPFIKQRCLALNIDITMLEYTNHIDYMDLYKKYSKKTLKSYSLNSVANYEIKKSKIEQEKGGGAIYRTWLNNKQDLETYNMEDSNLIYEMNKKLMFIEVSMKRANNAGCHVRNTVNNSDSGDFLLMRGYKKANTIMPSQPNKAELERRKKLEKIGGGFTTCFRPGFYPFIEVWDFKSLYPSIIEKWNISPETFVAEIHKEEDALAIDKTKFIVTPSDFENYYHPHRVYRIEKGVIPTVVAELVAKRDLIKYPMAKYKNKLNKDGTENPDYDADKYKQLYLEQYALKTDANSIYGILSFPQSRYYSWALGDSVTTCARATIKECYKKLELWGCHVIGGDTDSTFVSLNGQDWKEIDKKFVIFLAEWGQRWFSPYKDLIFEHEKTFKPMFFVMKKNYAYIDEGQITIKGMECVKSDSNLLAARLQEQFVIEVLQEKVDNSYWEKKIDELQTRVFDQKMTKEELIMVKSLTKMPKEYEGFVIDKKTKKPKIKANGELQSKSIPAHVKLADRQLQQGKDIFVGTKIKYIIVKTKPNLALSPEEFEKGSGTFLTKVKKRGEVEYEFSGEYDVEYYWVRILKPLLKVMHCYYGKIPKWNWNLTDAQMHKLISMDDEEDE